MNANSPILCQRAVLRLFGQWIRVSRARSAWAFVAAVAAWWAAGAISARADTVVTTNSATQLQQALNAGGRVSFNFSGLLSVTNTLIVTNSVTLDGGTNSVTLNGGGSLSFVTNPVVVPTVSYETNVVNSNTVITATTNYLTNQVVSAVPSTNGVRLFFVASNVQFTLLNLTLASGQSTNGGAIFNRGNLLASNCAFSGNTAFGPNGRDGAAGADRVNNGDPGGNGMSGSNALGGALCNFGTAVVLRCTFGTNIALGGNGGLGGKGGNGSLVGGDAGNGGSGGQASGGAIFNAGWLTLVESTVGQNSSSGGAGGLGGAGGTGAYPGDIGIGGAGGFARGAGVFNQGWATILGCTIYSNGCVAGNSAKGGTGGNSFGTTGAAGGASQGGGVCNVGTNTLLNSTIFANGILGGDGGDGGDDNEWAGRGGNGGDALGGGVYNSGRLYATNCTFARSGALGGLPGVAGTAPLGATAGVNGGSYGGNIANMGSAFLLKNCILAGPEGGASFTNFGVRTNITTVSTNVPTNMTVRITSTYVLTNCFPIAAPGCLTNFVFTTNTVPPVSPSRTNTFVLTNAVCGAFPNQQVCLTNITFDTVVTTNVTMFIQVTNIVLLTNTASGINSYGTITSAGYNISSDATPTFSGTSVNNTDPDLGALANNGGPTRTLAPQFGSPAINGADPATALPTDQRGVPRPQAGRADIGAVETDVLSLTGVVTFEDDGLQGVAIRAVLGATTNTALTDADGVYVFTNLALGTYSVTPELAGFTFTPSQSSTVIGATTATNDFVAERFYAIVGRVTLGTNGVPDVVIHATLGNTTTDAITDETGHYSFTNLASGTYSLVPELEGYEFTPPAAVAVVGGAVAVQDFSALGLYSIAGTVLGPGGLGLANVEVSDGLSTITTDSTGFYWLTGVPPGLRTVTATRAGYGFVPASQEVNVNSVLVGDVNFEGFPAFTVAGRVYDGSDDTATLGLSNVAIHISTTLLTSGGDEVVEDYETVTDTNGYYTVTGVLSGELVVFPESPGFMFSPSEIETPLTGDIFDADFIGDRSYAINGRVTHGGAGLEGVTVTAGLDIAITDGDGYYAISNLFDGDYDVFAAAPGYAFVPAIRQVTLGPTNAAGADFSAQGNLSISGVITWTNAPVTNVILSLTGPTNQVINTGNGNTYTFTHLTPGAYVITPSLAGYYFDPNPSLVPLVSDSVTANFVAIPRLNIRGKVTNNATGTGLSGVTITVGGTTATTSASGDFLLASVAATNIVVPAKTGYVFSPALRRLDQGGDLSKLDFAAFSVGTISGQLLEGTNGLPNRTVSAIGTNLIGASSTGSFTANTDSQGRFSLLSLPPGNYTVTPPTNGVGFLPLSRTFLLPASGSITDAIFSAKPPVISISRLTNAQQKLTVLAQPSRTYRLQSSTNLAPGSWTNFLTNTTAANGVFTTNLTNTASFRSRFIRVQAP